MVCWTPAFCFSGVDFLRSKKPEKHIAGGQKLFFVSAEGSIFCVAKNWSGIRKWACGLFRKARHCCLSAILAKNYLTKLIFVKMLWKRFVSCDICFSKTYKKVFKTFAELSARLFFKTWKPRVPVSPPRRTCVRLVGMLVLGISKTARSVFRPFSPFGENGGLFLGSDSTGHFSAFPSI